MICLAPRKELKMTKIIELAHALGEEIAKSEQMKKLSAAKDAYDKDADLQAKMSEYEADRVLLAQEFSKSEDSRDERAVADIRARIEELTGEIISNKSYADFMEAQQALNTVMAEVNAEIKYCISGERPSECTHDCSTCAGCH